MNLEDKYYLAWLKDREGLLSKQESQDLIDYLKVNPSMKPTWELMESQILVFSNYDSSFSDDFDNVVMNKWQENLTLNSEQPYRQVAYVSIAAVVVLMLNLFLGQNSISIEALLGIVDMTVEDTSLLFYVN